MAMLPDVMASVPHAFVAVSLIIGFWKLIGIALDQFRYWNNHD